MRRRVCSFSSLIFESSEKEDFGLFGGVFYNGEAERVHKVEITGAWVENVAFSDGKDKGVKGI